MPKKTTKTYSKRIKITKNGKLIRRKMGMSHFKAKKDAKSIRNLRSHVSVDFVDVKTLKAHL